MKITRLGKVGLTVAGKSRGVGVNIGRGGISTVHTNASKGTAVGRTLGLHNGPLKSMPVRRTKLDVGPVKTRVTTVNVKHAGIGVGVYAGIHHMRGTRSENKHPQVRGY